MKLHLLSFTKFHYFFDIFSGFSKNRKTFFNIFTYIYVGKSIYQFSHTSQIIGICHILCFVLTVCDSHCLRSPSPRLFVPCVPFRIQILKKLAFYTATNNSRQLFVLSSCTIRRGFLLFLCQLRKNLYT